MHVARFTAWLAEQACERASAPMTVRTFAEADFDHCPYGLIIRTPSYGWAFVQCVSTSGPEGDPVVTGPPPPVPGPAPLPPGSPTLVCDIEAWLAWTITAPAHPELASITRYSHVPELGLHPASHGVRVVCHSGRTLYLMFRYLLSSTQRVRPSALFAAPTSI